jgi:hypothetical protein
MDRLDGADVARGVAQRRREAGLPARGEVLLELKARSPLGASWLLGIAHEVRRAGGDELDALIAVRAAWSGRESDRPTFRLCCVGCGADAGKCSTRGAGNSWADGTRAVHADGAGGVVCTHCSRERAEAPVLDFAGHGEAVRAMQGAHAAEPLPGDVDLFTGALFEAPVSERGARVLVLGGGVQEPLF